MQCPTGLEIIAMSMPQYYELLGGIKLLGAGLVLLAYSVISWWARSKILGVLEQSGTQVSLRRAVCCGSSSGSTTGAEKAIMTIKRKFCEWYTVAILGIVACFLFGAYTLSEYVAIDAGANTWIVKFEDQPQATHIGFEILYASTILLVIRLFNVPSAVDHRRLDSQGSKTEVRPY